MGSGVEWRYTRGEVLYLLSLKREDAIDEDAGQPDSCAMLSPDDLPSTTHAEWDPVFAIARWHDVQGAKRRLEKRWERVHAELGLEIVELRAREATEEQVAELVGLHRLAARRRFHATLEDIMRELGGAAETAERTSAVSACMKCARRPRARRRELVRKRKGRPPQITPERMSSLCWDCAPQVVRQRLIPPRHVREAAA